MSFARHARESVCGTRAFPALAAADAPLCPTARYVASCSGALDDFAAGLERSLFSSAKGGRVLQSIRLALIKRSLPPSLLCEVAQIIDLDSLEPSPPPAAGDVMSTAPDKMPTAAARKRQGEARFPQAGDSAPSGAGVDLSPCSESAVDCAEGPVADQAHESPGEDRPPQEEQEEQEFGTEGVSSGSEGEFRDSDDDAVAPSALSTASEDAEARMGPGPDPVPVDGAGSASETDDSSASVDALEARLSAESLAPQPAPESWHVKSPYAPETSSGEAPSREAAAVYTAACAAAEARPVRRFLSALVAQGAVHLEVRPGAAAAWRLLIQATPLFLAPPRATSSRAPAGRRCATLCSTLCAPSKSCTWRGTHWATPCSSWCPLWARAPSCVSSTSATTASAQPCSTPLSRLPPPPLSSAASSCAGTASTTARPRPWLAPSATLLPCAASTWPTTISCELPRALAPLLRPSSPPACAAAELRRVTLEPALWQGSCARRDASCGR